MNSHPRYPNADAYLRVFHKGEMMYWLAHCPFCGNLHSHGAGRIIEEVDDNLGLRVAPCRFATTISYNLIRAGTYEEMLEMDWHKSQLSQGPRDNYYEVSDKDFHITQRFPFGQYRGKITSDIDKTYLAWLLTQQWFTRAYPRATRDIREFIK